MKEVKEYVQAEKSVKDEIEKASDYLTKSTHDVKTEMEEIISECEDNPGMVTTKLDVKVTNCLDKFTVIAEKYLL